MVQVIGRNRPTFGEQVSGGIQQGGQAGQQLAQSFLQDMMGQKSKVAEQAQKLATFDKIKKTPEFQALSPLKQFSLENEILGQISGGTSKSLINAEREQLENDFINQILGGGNAPSLSNAPTEEPSIPEPSENKPTLTVPKKEGRLSNLNMGDLQKMIAKGGKPKDLAESEIKRREHEEKIGLEKQSRNFKRNEKYINRLEESAAGVRKMDLSLNQMGAALDTGKFEDYRNTASELLGYEFLKNSPAQVVNSSIKEFLIAGLSEITGRPNQFLEQSLTKAAINPQYEKVANRAIFEGLKLLNDLKKKEIKVASELEDFYVRTEGETPRNFHKLVQEEVDKYAEPAMQSYNDYIKNLLGGKSSNEALGKDEIMMIDTQGKKRAVPANQQQEALNAGYKLSQ